jgi:hypothetical protein
MLSNHVRHDPQSGFVLTFVFLTKSFVDLDVDRLAAPFEFFAAAARTGPVRVESHVSS